MPSSGHHFSWGSFLPFGVTYFMYKIELIFHKLLLSFITLSILQACLHIIFITLKIITISYPILQIKLLTFRDVKVI